MSGNPPSRHLWVGGLPEEIGELEIKDIFTKYGKVEGVKILPQRYPNQGVAAFIDFYDVRSAVDAKDAKIVYGGCELRTNFKTKSTERFDKYDHSSRRDLDYGKEPPYSGKRVGSPSPPPEREKEPKEKNKDKEKSRGKESSTSSSSSSSSSGSSSSDGSSSESEGGGKKSRKKGKTEVNAPFLKITNLASRPERVLQDGLYYEFTRYCPTAVVRMYGDGRDMSAIVKFDSKESCKKAYSEAQGLLLFGNKLKVTPVDRDDFPAGGRDIQVVPPGPGSGGMLMGKAHPTEDIDPQATHSLFVGNIPKNISVYELKDIFQRFGDVVDVEIKKMSGSATYGFVLFYDLLSAVSAKQLMDGENIHGNNIRVGFGKGTPSKMLWVDGIDPDMSESVLERSMTKYGKVVRLGIDHQRSSAMVQFDSIEAAKDALNGVKGTFIGNSRRIMTDFANRDARAAFFSRVEGGGDLVGPPRSFPGPGMYGPGGMGPGPRAMMMPRPGVPMMGMGRGGYPPMAGPPMDMYYYNPYMGEGMGFYGQPHFPRGPPMRGMRRYHPRGRVVGGPGGGHYEENYDDYGDELRAFTRKREIEKKWKERRKRHSSSDESGGSDSENGSVSRHKKKSSRDKDKSKKARKDKNKEDDKRGKDAGSEVSSGEEELSRKEEARLKATQRSRDLREKLKKKNHKKGREGSVSDVEPSRQSASDNETDSRKSIKRSRDKEKEKDNDRKKEGDQEKDHGSEKKERGSEKERGKEQERRSVKKGQEGKAKEKVRGSEKDGERKKEKEKERELEKKTEHHKSLTAEKQSVSSEDKGKGSTKELTKKRPQQTKLKKNDRMSDKSSRSSSDSKTPTTPPTPAKKPSFSTKTKTASPPMTPTTPPESDMAVAEVEDTLAHSPHTTSKVSAGEKMDTQEPHSPVTNTNKLKREELTASDVRRGHEEETAGVPETPESPPAQPKKKKSEKVESDLSSGEEFPESTTGSPLTPSGTAREEAKKEKVGTGGDKDEKLVKPTDAAEPVKFRMKISGSSSQSRVRHGSGVVSPPTAQWSPDAPSSHRSTPSQSHGSPPPPRSQHSPPHPPPSTAASHRSPPPPRLSGDETEEGSRKSRKLPRCYQLEEERLREKQRETKEHSHPKPHPPPTTPSPPPAYATHRRRPAHSPPPDHSSRWRRGRHYTHGHQFGPRPYSRSPPPSGYPQSPPPPHSGGRSPYSGSPPPRPRTPIQRPRDRGGPRHRYDSPPYDMPHGKHGRRGSSPMRHMSPSPPLPRRRSPVPGHRHQRRYSRSPSPQRRSPLRRKERSLSPESSRSSPRYSEDRLEVRKYGKKPPVPVYSRSPSPKPKRRDAPPREDYPDSKRRRIDDARIKSPTGGPSAQKDEQLKSSRADKSQQSPYPSSGGPSDRHTPHHTVKESQGQGGVTQGNPASHHAAAQGKTSSSLAVAASSTVAGNTPTTKPSQQPTDNLMDLLRRYPVMWQGHLTLKNESAAVQLHFLSGNVQLAKSSLPGTGEGRSPALRIAQRMRLEQTQLEGVQRRMQNDSEHCLLLALPCGRDAGDVRAQTHALKNSLISYLLQKQAAGIINVPGSQTGFVLHIFPPCQFSQTHLSRVAPDLLSSASDNCHLMIVVATM